jgi:hypothetical protein
MFMFRNTTHATFLDKNNTKSGFLMKKMFGSMDAKYFNQCLIDMQLSFIQMVKNIKIGDNIKVDNTWPPKELCDKYASDFMFMK